MKLPIFAMAAATAVATALPSTAATITARDPNSVLEALKELGYPASMTTAPSGGNAIEMRVEGAPSYIDFWNCDQSNRNCETLMLVYGMDLKDGTTADKANEWNADTIHGFIYLDKDSDPWLNLTIATGDGISDTLFADIMRVWRTRVGDVRKFFDM